MTQPANPAIATTGTPSGALLSVRGVTVRFGGVVALDDVSFDVQQGHICVSAPIEL